MLRGILAVVASLVLAFVLVIGVELWSAVVHPFPAGFQGTEAEICKHVERYPDWVLAVCAVAWGATAFASTWVATRIGNRIPGVIIGSLLTIGVIFNIAKLPYPTWFEVVILLVIPVTVLVALRFGHKSPAAVKLAVAAPES